MSGNWYDAIVEILNEKYNDDADSKYEISNDGNTFTLNSGTELSISTEFKIPENKTLVNNGIITNPPNIGTIRNYGIINNTDGTIFNTAANGGGLINEGEITNTDGVINNYGGEIHNDGGNGGKITNTDGVINNRAQGEIHNWRFGEITNTDGVINNGPHGEINNWKFGKITNTGGTIYNSDGVINNSDGGIIDNGDGTIDNNYGKIDNGDGTITNTGGTITNEGGTITGEIIETQPTPVVEIPEPVAGGETAGKETADGEIPADDTPTPEEEVENWWSVLGDNINYNESTKTLIIENNKEIQSGKELSIPSDNKMIIEETGELKIKTGASITNKGEIHNKGKIKLLQGGYLYLEDDGKIKNGGDFELAPHDDGYWY